MHVRRRGGDAKQGNALRHNASEAYGKRGVILFE
jgi:hypothetical protein